MKNYIIALALLGTLVTPAFAQQTPTPTPTPVSPSSEIMHVSVNWANLQNAVAALIHADQQKQTALVNLQQDAAALAEYWKQYIAGLKPSK